MAYFANFEVSSTTVNHNCILSKEAKKQKNQLSKVKLDVAPRCQNFGSQTVFRAAKRPFEGPVTRKLGDRPKIVILTHLELTR